MKRLVIGILAHVDSGKTTLSEGLLYLSGEIMRQGRVDHGDSFLDTNEIERDRGITIFSKQAVLHTNNAEFTLLDTPGHVDFASETERTLAALDYAILVISGSDGVQSHTETLWRLLRRYNIPTFIFVNKTDLPSFDKKSVCSDLKKRLSDACLDFKNQDSDFFESAAMADDSLLEEYTETDNISCASLISAIAAGKIFPCFFGSALKNDGIGEFLKALDFYTQNKSHPDSFGAKIFKIADDDKGRRLAYMKITGGSLKVKTVLSNGTWSEKANEVRIYSGTKYQSVQEAFAGSICAVTGLTKAAAGEGLGFEKNSLPLVCEPVFTYSVKITDGTDINEVLAVFRKLEQEETQLHIIWNEHLRKIDVQIMGEVQLEVLKRILAERFGISVEFEGGSIIYKETISDMAEGVGHYEPLRHYAEVHLLLESAPRGSGLTVSSRCSEDVLNKNWQRLILTHLKEKTHTGVLTGSPITDIKITLINGRAHQKHTEGGDFRQATYRAVRQGLMQANSILLEPYYDFSLEIPTESAGRAMTDLQQMGADFSAPLTDGEMSVITGSAPISAIREYHKEVISYTRGRGRLQCIFKGYEPCKNQEEIVSKIGYDCESDPDNSADSVFCAHGSGFIVKWDKVFDYMHIPAMKLHEEEITPHAAPRTSSAILAGDDELLRIFEQTYGKIQRKLPQKLKTTKEKTSYKTKVSPVLPEYLLIDGYNIVFAWDELKKVAEKSLDDARILLISRICNYRAMRQNNVILVFDAYKVKGMQREIENIHGVSVVYTKEAETADAYIEKTSRELCKNYRVRVATSDNLEQMIIFGHGARRTSAGEFHTEVETAEQEMREFVKNNNQSIDKVPSITKRSD